MMYMKKASAVSKTAETSTDYTSFWLFFNSITNG